MLLLAELCMRESGWEAYHQPAGKKGENCGARTQAAAWRRTAPTSAVRSAS